MRVRVTLEYDLDLKGAYPGSVKGNRIYKTFREELLMMSRGEQGLPGKCIYAAIETVFPSKDVVKS